MTERPEMREGETLDQYAARLEEILERTEANGPFETWLWANLEREMIRQLAAAQETFPEFPSGDSLTFRAPGPAPAGSQILGDSLTWYEYDRPPAAAFGAHVRREAERCADVLTQHLIATGVIPAGNRVKYDTTPIYLTGDPIGEHGPELVDLATARKVGAFLPVSNEILMDAGVIPDTRPSPARATLRRRLAWWWAGWWDDVRMRAGELVAGRRFDDE